MLKIKDCRYGPMMFLEQDNIIGKSLDQYGESQFHEISLLQQVLRPGDVVVDAGANIGVLTVPLAQTVGEDGFVVAVEAQPFVFNILCGNLALNGLQNVQPFNRAIADVSGILAFMPELNYRDDDNYGGVPLGSEFNSKDSGGRSLTKPIPTLTIDDLNLSQPRLIKLDVEGMEVPALLGALNTISRAKPVLHVEFILDREGILKILKDLGYEWRIHEPPLFNKDNYFGCSSDILRNKEGVNIVSGDLLCWHPDNPVIVESQYFVDLETSRHPRHEKIRRIRDQVYGS